MSTFLIGTSFGTFLIGTSFGILLILFSRAVRTHGPTWWAMMSDKRPVTSNFRIDLTINGEDHSFVTYGQEGCFVMHVQQRDGRDYANPPWEVKGFAAENGELTFSVGRGRIGDLDPMYFKRKTHRNG